MLKSNQEFSLYSLGILITDFEFNCFFWCFAGRILSTPMIGLVAPVAWLFKHHYMQYFMVFVKCELSSQSMTLNLGTHLIGKAMAYKKRLQV